MNEKSVLAIIPARGGSKRIPRKNIRNFAGKPIIAYSIEAAAESMIFDEVMVSTDDTEIAGISKKYGAAVPFLRTAETANDTADIASVFIEVIKQYRNTGKNFGIICGIYPCAPFITAEKLKKGLDIILNTGADSVIPVVKYSYPPQRGLFIRDDMLIMCNREAYLTRSQDFEPMYHDAGQFFFIREKALLEQRRIFCRNTLPVILPESEVQDIDTEEDWITAELKYMRFVCFVA